METAVENRMENPLGPYWIGFNLAKGIGPARLRGLLDAFGDVKTAWEASMSDLRAAGLGKVTTERLVQLRSSIDIHALWDQYRANGITILTWDDETYPKRLLETHQPPPVLYMRGALDPNDHWAISIVGTRRVTQYGKQVTAQITRHLAQNGITIVSGLARGVDAIAHQTALDAGGRTLGVLGCGVDVIYPPEHRRIAEDMLAQGALISDFAPGTPPDGPNFPARNRIISGLTQAVIVVEAGKRSGALITAEFALEQGREVFAVPGPITAPQSKGTNRLIKNGAHPLLDPSDVLEFLDLTRVTAQREARSLLPMTSLEEKLAESIADESLHVDEISIKTNIPIAQVTSTLTMMELKGMVQQVGSMRYIALREDQDEYQA